MKRLPRASTIAEAIELLAEDTSPKDVESIFSSLADALNVDQNEAKRAVCDILKIAVRFRPALSSVLEKLR